MQTPSLLTKYLECAKKGCGTYIQKCLLWKTSGSSKDKATTVFFSECLFQRYSYQVWNWNFSILSRIVWNFVESWKPWLLIISSQCLQMCFDLLWWMKIFASFSLASSLQLNDEHENCDLLESRIFCLCRNMVPL